MPIVLCACEATWPSKGIVKSLDRLVNQAVGKIFNTYDPNEVQFIRSMVNLDDIQVIVRKRQEKFLIRFENKLLYFTQSVLNSCFKVDILPLNEHLKCS